jgi:hypothetical protein
MEAIYVFLFLILGLTIGFGILLGQSSRVDTMAHWNERRCDLDAMLLAFYYKPDDDKRSALKFSGDNFNFCIGSMTTNYLKSLFGALFEVLRTQMGAADIMRDVMTNMRTQLNTIYKPFSEMMNKFWDKFKQIGSLSSRIFQHLFMSMKKAAAIGISSVYMALSLQTAFLNGIDLAINVIMVVLYICIALAFIFFLPILPLLVIVLMSVAGIESAMPGRTGDMGAVFGCFAEETPITMSDGSVKEICKMNLGDILENGQIVESVIELPGSDELYEIDGIYVTGDHRIWDNTVKRWLMVKEYQGSILSSRKTTVIWTLITSDRTIPIKGKLFADWEELPDTEEAGLLWEKMARDILKSPTQSLSVPNNAPCFHGEIKVREFQAGCVSISSIKRGDWILGEYEWTQVIGVCHRKVSGGIGSSNYRMTSGVWMKQGDIWDHPSESEDSTAWSGIHLLTDSAKFKILSEDLTDEILVRDFTEVGFDRLPETYTRVEEAMIPPKKTFDGE